jgi:hypothetical protein
MMMVVMMMMMMIIIIIIIIMCTVFAGTKRKEIFILLGLKHQAVYGPLQLLENIMY